MARPRKEGLDYFPHDTTPDSKLEKFYLLYEAKGKSFFYTMLEEIYREGPGITVSDAETRLILSRKCFCTVEEWNTMLARALLLGLFDAQIFEKSMVLTSNGIRKRFEVVAKKRKNNAKFHQKKVSAAETSSESQFQPGFTFARKERKGKEIKDPSAPRKQDPVWDTLVDVFSFKPPHPKKEATRIGAAVRDLKLKGATPEAIRAKFAQAKATWNGGKLFGPEALLKHWDALQAPIQQTSKPYTPAY